MTNTSAKPVIGISCGDLNGIGLELIIKAFSDNRLLDLCTPVIFASNKVVNFYRKSISEINFNYQSTKEYNRLNNKQVNVFNCWEEEVAINPGQLEDAAGKYAILSLQTAVAALKQQQVDGLVTAPIHKKNIQSADFNYTGHTPYLKEAFGVNDVVMMLCAGNFRVALVTEHVPVKDIAQYITKENILSKLTIIHKSLQRDFGIDRPRIAVLGLNPHAGDEGLVGKEEETIIKPAIKEAKNNNMLVVGPFSADAFFARRQYEKFDAVLAMYHDQGLIPFKALASGEGVNYTAGLPVVRTSPDHGVAFDIAGKDKADTSSFLTSIFECIDIIQQRSAYDTNRSNPLKKINPEVFARMEDEEIRE
ncbi:MAG: 4-hydroxythreonine-4-phosphate dehydrogenase PdxA [Sphingobacteriales bacterium]|mgnify:CR=1 FL=1|nr:4-hydroxythreonine-4-phosphate dehydrogenase PdxA [Sphingobacteriales bacterium]OJW02923.1 MAG: 4-hydroxythreonine-4-phosphate dehydrogenase PdxA [Sphingobacteriales bacterium 44-61]